MDSTFIYENKRICKCILVLETPNKGRSFPRIERNKLKRRAEYERINKNQEWFLFEHLRFKVNYPDLFKAQTDRNIIKHLTIIKGQQD